MTIESAWKAIETWADGKGIDLMLRPGASAKEIADAEKALGVTFPEDFRASLRIHDGQDDDVEIEWLPYALRLGSLESLVECWKDDREGHDPEHAKLMGMDKGKRLKLDPSHAGHIPIAGSPYWDYDRLLLDFEPGPNGTSGQVIARFDIETPLVAPSFGALLEQLAAKLSKAKAKKKAAPAKKKKPAAKKPAAKKPAAKKRATKQKQKAKR